jgi:hypothetical protein
VSDGLGPFYLKEKPAEIDEGRRLLPEVVARLRDAGMFRLAMPKDWGGPELSTIEQIEVVEELSKASGSVGWHVMIGCDSEFVTGYLDDRVARELFPRLVMATAGNFFPTGGADGGCKVNGQWALRPGITRRISLCQLCYLRERFTLMKDGVPMSRRMVARMSI